MSYICNETNKKKMYIKAQVFKYDIIRVIPLGDLNNYKEHRRLKVFYNKGVECANPKCNVVGTQLALGCDNKGNKHIDLYTDNFYPLTVDHIIPKSKGGSDELDNLQPMCSRCNTIKGSQLDWDGISVETTNGETINSNTFTNLSEGMVGVLVYKKNKNGNFKELGVVSKYVINPHIGELQFMVEGNDTSMYSIKKGYIN